MRSSTGLSTACDETFPVILSWCPHGLSFMFIALCLLASPAPSPSASSPSFISSPGMLLLLVNMSDFCSAAAACALCMCDSTFMSSSSPIKTSEISRSCSSMIDFFFSKLSYNSVRLWLLVLPENAAHSGTAIVIACSSPFLDFSSTICLLMLLNSSFSSLTS
uniref:Uncharacterized protein n=1 Tax=Opuntia streptacantha TaxID=393608 RepID=A0A7C9DHH1_OPUST